MTSWYTENELRELFNGSAHPSALVSRNAKFYGSNIHIGENSRVDDFCVISGAVAVGPYVHIAMGCAIYGGKTGVTFGKHSSMSPHGLVMAESDTFDGTALIGPTHPAYTRNVKRIPVVIAPFAALGARCTVLPGGGLMEGAVAGAHSLVTSVLPGWTICVGTPAKPLRARAAVTMLTLADLVRMGHRDGEQH